MSYKIETNRSSRLMSFFPGNSAIGVFHNAYMKLTSRHKGFGSSENAAAVAYANTTYHVDYLLCTVDTDNVAQLKIMQNNGWEQLKKINTCSGPVFLYGKQLSTSEV